MELQEISNYNLNLYPNPTSGVVTFESPDKYKEIAVEVYDQLGKKVMDKSFNNTFNGQFTIDAAPGIYFTTIKTNSEKLSILKLVKL